MSAPLHVAAALAYLTGFMFAARWVYGHLRAREIDRLRADYPALYSEPGSAVRRFYETYRGHAVMMAMLAAMVWPLALLLHGVHPRQVAARAWPAASGRPAVSGLSAGELREALALHESKRVLLRVGDDYWPLSRVSVTALRGEFVLLLTAGGES